MGIGDVTFVEMPSPETTAELCSHSVDAIDEAEWMKNDAAARWLQKNENRALRKGDHRFPAQHAAASGIKLPRRKSLKRRLADLDPCDPHDQLPGVDMRRMPWR